MTPQKTKRNVSFFLVLLSAVPALAAPIRNPAFIPHRLSWFSLALLVFASLLVEIPSLKRLLNRGWIGAIFFGAFADWRKDQGFEGRDQWDPAFYLCVATLFLAGMLWQFVRQRNAVGESIARLDEARADEPLPHTIQAKPDGGPIREGPPPSAGS